MTLSQRHVSSRSVADSLRSVTIVLTATTILAGRITAAGSIDWDIVLTMVIISTATSEANILSSVLNPQLIVAPVPSLKNDEKNEENFSLNNQKIQTYRLSEENLRRVVRPSTQDTFLRKVENIRDLVNLLKRTENVSKTNSFSSLAVNTRDTDSAYFNFKTLDSENTYEAIARRRSVDTYTCLEIKTSKFCICNESSVICDNLNLSEIVFDKPFPKEVKIISITQNHLCEIPNISGARYLVEMVLAHNKIKEADVRKLANFLFLEELNLSSNELQVLDLTPLALQHLKVLHASSNRLEKLLSSSLPLTELFLERNNITDVSFLTNFPNLRKLNISYNQVKYIAENVFQHLSDLNILDLRNNQIVNAEFLSFIPRHLRTLILSNNKISYIPDQTFRNKYLVDLSLDNNALTKVSFAIYLNVARLKLNNNPLFQINGNFFEIKNLRFLDVSATNITSMNFIFRIPRLYELRIEDNNITNLPEMFLKNYPPLKRLFLQGNPLEDLMCSFSPTCMDTKICEECKFCVMLGDVVIYLKDENINCKINCVMNFRQFTTKCEQRYNSASQTLISVFLILFLNAINVL